MTTQSIYRRLWERNRRLRWPLGPTQHREDFPWCQERAAWIDSDWRKLVISDEFQFNLSPDNKRTSMWKWPRQWHELALTVKLHTAYQRGVMEWGAISVDTRTALVILHDTLNAQRYVGVIVRSVLLLFLSQHPGLIFQHDNARPQKTFLPVDCFLAFPTLPSPTRTPDLYSIEPDWSLMGWTAIDLDHQLESVRNPIPLTTIRSLCAQMARSIIAFNRAKGGTTPL